jgi:hypothetical protein
MSEQLYSVSYYRNRQGKTYVNKGSRNNDSSAELLENCEDDVGAHGDKGGHEDRTKDTD